MRTCGVVSTLAWIAACGGPGAPASRQAGGGEGGAPPAPGLSATQAGVGPIGATTRADVATLRELLPGYRVEAAQEQAGDDAIDVIHVRDDAGIVMTVVPDDDGAVGAIWVDDTEAVSADDAAARASGGCAFRELDRFPGAWCPDGNLWFVYSPDGTFLLEDGDPVGEDALEMAILEVVLWIPGDDAGE